MLQKTVTILVVDDDKDDREFLELAFKEGGYPGDLIFAEDGEFAWELLQNQALEPSLILLDINMPRLNGLSLLTRIRENTALKALPVLMFTTSEQEETIKKAYEQGANSYIVKPQTYQDLAQTWKQIYAYWAQIIELPSKGLF